MKKSKVLAALAFAALLFVFTGCPGTAGNNDGGDSQGGNTSLNGQENTDKGTENSGDKEQNQEGQNQEGENQTDNNQDDDDQNDDNQTDDNQNDDNQTDDNQNDDNQTDDNQTDENQDIDENAPDILEPTYVYFGLYPQTAKADDVEILTETEVKVNGWDAYEGSDGSYYVEWIPGPGSVDLTPRYFKIEPIKWRVLTAKYNHDSNSNTPGLKLLVADQILDACEFYDNRDSNRYEQVGNTPIYPNNYCESRVRAFLNGIGYYFKKDDSAAQTENKEFLANGFLQKAFSLEQINDIAITWVDNSTDKKTDLNTGVEYKSNMTNDRIFLLSATEVTSSRLGFADDWQVDEARVRTSTDYASTVSYRITDGGRWYLRSPYNQADTVRWIDQDGKPNVNYGNVKTLHGIVPALCLTSEDHLESNTVVPNENQEYMFFGSYPQSKKSQDVSFLYSSPTAIVRGLPAYIGDDGEYYVESGYDYYKIEPIKWRVLTDNYDHDKDPSTPGKKLLVADKSLYTTPFYEYWQANRTADDDTVYLNNYEHSRIRAYLNGLKYLIKEDATSVQMYNTEFEGNGFLQNAFTPGEFDSIAYTTVDNADDSIEFACRDTQDKVFLLSQKEVTMIEYGYADENVDDQARLHEMTDYAQSKGGCFDYWWLRTPAYNPYFEPHESSAYYVCEGRAPHDEQVVYQGGFGVVPAICLE